MQKLRMDAYVCALAVLIVAACSSEATRSNSGRPGLAVTTETPAPAQEPGKSFIYNFDNDSVERMPAKFHSALTGSATNFADSVVRMKNGRIDEIVVSDESKVNASGKAI